MDWGNVSAQELVVALKEVDWNQKPRPLSEFFSRFTPPKTRSKWTSRLKSYYYRVNYFGLVVLCFCVSFLRNPLAFFAIAAASFATLCLNDSFAHTAVRITRKIHPPLSVFLRNPTATATTAGSRAYARSKVVYLLGQDRRVVLSAWFAISILLIMLTGAMRTLARTLAVSLGSVLLHASLRSPNLKARLNSYNEEFRAIWRSSYAEA